MQPKHLCCRSSIPVFTCLMAIFVEAKTPSSGEAASLALLTAGVMLSVWEGQLAGSSGAIMLCITGTVSNAAMMSMTGRLLSEKVDVLRLTFYTAPVSCLLLVPVFLSREVRGLHSSSSLQQKSVCLCLLPCVIQVGALLFMPHLRNARQFQVCGRACLAGSEIRDTELHKAACLRIAVFLLFIQLYSHTEFRPHWSSPCLQQLMCAGICICSVCCQSPGSNSWRRCHHV